MSLGASVGKTHLATFVPTVIRTRGDLVIGFDNAAADQDCHVAFGLIVVSSVAAGLGITGLPGPFTDAANDGWFVHQFASFRPAATVQDSDAHVARYIIDSKAMRKIDAEERIVVVAEIGALDGGSAYCSGQIRLLSKEA